MSFLGQSTNPIALDPLTSSIASKYDKTGYNFMGGYRNKIINGNFDIWQRGTSQTSSGYGSADRWQSSNAGTTKTASQQLFTLGQTDVPGYPTLFFRHVVSSVAGSASSCTLEQKIEGVRTFSGTTVTVTFYAKADTVRNMVAEMYQYFGTGGSPSAPVTGIGSTTFALSTTWQKFQTVINVPSTTGKTLGTNGGAFLSLRFWFDAGSSFNSITNSLGQQSGTFDIARVSVVEGNAIGEIDPFDNRHVQQELSLCQRYYEIGEGWLGGYSDAASRNCYCGVPFKVVKRTVPTTAYGIVTNVNVSTFDARNVTSNGLNWFCATTASGGFSWNGTWTADAEL